MSNLQRDLSVIREAEERGEEYYGPPPGYPFLPAICEQYADCISKTKN